jgi:hypothetical protein
MAIDIFSMNIEVFYFHTKMDISSPALSRRHQITVRVTDHFRIVGPQYGACFMLHFWSLEFGISP